MAFLFHMDKATFSLLFVVGFALLGVVGDFFLKLAGNGQKFMEVKWFLIGFLIYASTAFGWFYVMKHLKLATVGTVYAVIIVLLLSLIGTFYFHEQLKLFEIIGIAMAIISLVLLGRFA